MVAVKRHTISSKTQYFLRLLSFCGARYKISPAKAGRYNVHTIELSPYISKLLNPKNVKSQCYCKFSCLSPKKNWCRATRGYTTPNLYLLVIFISVIKILNYLTFDSLKLVPYTSVKVVLYTRSKGITWLE